MLDITVGDRQLAYWILSRNKEETYMACKAALDIINEIYEDNKNLSIDEHFEVCISITTGKVIKAQKTIMGDYVNFGARLASAGKEYGVKILIDENTYSVAKNHVLCRGIDTIFVKGGGLKELYELIDYQ